MKEDVGIAVNGHFVEQHGAGSPYRTEESQSASGSSAPGTGGLLAVKEGLVAGRKFARRCEIEGVANRAFRI
jgi:hypothetical protein